MRKTLIRLIAAVVFASALGACATAPVDVKVTKRFFWPPEPDEPRIEWITQYTGDLDLKEKNFISSLVGDDSFVTFGRPVSVAGDGEDRFVVVDSELGQVFNFNLKTKKVAVLGGSEKSSIFTKPTGVAVDGEGNAYAADSVSRKVYVANNENVIVRVMDLSEHLTSIGSLAVDRARGRLVVPDPKGNVVALYSLTGELQLKFSGKGSFAFPNAVAVASDGSLIIADSYNATLVHMSAEGKYIKNIGKRGDSAGDLALVTGVAIDSEDHIYVTDGRLHNLTIYDKEGNALLVVGGQHSIKKGNIGRGGFQIPQGIGIDKNDRIYVADSFNRRVQVLQYLNQRYLAEHPLDRVKPKP